MTAAPRFYITTPIYYVNDVPHIGHAYTTVVADAFARFHRRTGANVRFLTGTDEHGQKIERVAAEQGLTPRELADRVVVRFRDLWRRLEISNDDFIRTTEPRHKEFVQWMWRRMVAHGDIYLGSYKGWYCVGCEGFFTEKEIREGVCPMGHRNVEHREEPSYFFRLSRYQQSLLDLYDGRGEYSGRSTPFVAPDARLNEVRSFVAGGLDDLSVSRATIRWGIPVPDDPAHTVYVWLDALANYVSALGGPDGKDFAFWPALHLIGKDIVRFHAVYWPAFLMAAGLPVPAQVLAHGFWTVEGQKMSKSLRNVVDPHFLIDEYGADVVRYFLMREVPLGQDGDFSHSNLLGRINADLANDLGNLVSRTLGMVKRYREGMVGAAIDSTTAEDLDAEFQRLDAVITAIVSQHQPARALDHIWQLIGDLNRYIDHRRPWELHKAAQVEELDGLLRGLCEALVKIAALLDPFMPDTSRRILVLLGDPLPRGWTFDSVFPKGATRWQILGRGVQIGDVEPMFPRMDAAAIAARLAKVSALAGHTIPQAPVSASHNRDTAMDLITIDDFLRTEIKVGQVVSAEAVPKSEKLLRLGVDLAEGTPRTIVAGIAKSYKPEDLIGKRLLVVANLKPAKLMGIESQGMVLAGGTSGGVPKVIEPPPDVPVGTRIK